MNIRQSIAVFLSLIKPKGCVISPKSLSKVFITPLELNINPQMIETATIEVITGI